LPNGLHHRWTIKALRCGKHVLCEKPLSNNANEAREMVNVAHEQNRLLVEAFHYRYHPMCDETLKNLLSNKDELGSIISISGTFTVPSMFFNSNDIRFQYSLGGGAQMDLGCYLVSMCRFIVRHSYRQHSTFNDEHFQVRHVDVLRASSAHPQIDYGMRSEVTFDDIPCHIHCEFTNNWSFPKQELIVECDKATITIAYLIAPSFYHYITVRQRNTGQQRTIKNYADNQSTYFYQLQAFIASVQLAEQGSLDQAYDIAYTSGVDAIRNMEIIDEIYRQAGLAVRGEE
jgi:predicted dehydrogenase